MQIRIASLSDIPQMLSIAESWLNPILRQETSDGFLFGEAYTKNELAEIVTLGDAVVADLNGRVIGYFLVDYDGSNSTTRSYKRIMRDLPFMKDKDKLKICYRAQVALIKDFHGKGLSQDLTSFFKESIGDKYDLVLSLVSKSNPKMPAHSRAGWRIIGEYSSGYYVKLDF